MANSPSHKWVNGVLVERAIETNRWRVLPDGIEIGEDDEIEPKATKPYKPPTLRKRIAEGENKAVQSADTKKPAKKK